MRIIFYSTNLLSLFHSSRV